MAYRSIRFGTIPVPGQHEAVQREAGDSLAHMVRAAIAEHQAVPGCGSFEVRYTDGPANTFIGMTFPPAGLGRKRCIVRLRWRRRRPLRAPIAV